MLARTSAGARVQQTSYGKKLVRLRLDEIRVQCDQAIEQSENGMTGGSAALVMRERLFA